MCLVIFYLSIDYRRLLARLKPSRLAMLGTRLTSHRWWSSRACRKLPYQQRISTWLSYSYLSRSYCNQRSCTDSARCPCSNWTFPKPYHTTSKWNHPGRHCSLLRRCWASRMSNLCKRSSSTKCCLRCRGPWGRGRSGSPKKCAHDRAMGKLCKPSRLGLRQCHRAMESRGYHSMWGSELQKLSTTDP